MTTNANGRERGEYHAELDLKRGKDVGVAWNVRVVNDRGEIIQSNLINSSEKRQGGERVNTNKIAADLEDGFYTLQVRAVIAIPGDAEDLVEATQHIKVSDGKWTDIDDIQWRAESRATTAFTDVEAEDLARRTK